MLFTERPGRLRVVENNRLRPEPLAVIEDVETRSESGLMGLALHPRFGENRLLYLAYAYEQDGVKVRVVRFRETGTALTDRRSIIEGIPAAQYRAGTRLDFGPDGKLYVTTGDAASANSPSASTRSPVRRSAASTTARPSRPSAATNLRGDCIIRVALDGRRIV